MLHAREAHWQTPVIGAPHLEKRSLLRSDPRMLRVRRPLIMMMRSLATVCGEQGCSGLQAVAGLSQAPSGISPFCRKRHKAIASFRAKANALIFPFSDAEIEVLQAYAKKTNRQAHSAR
jgi:hypothetical protein